MSEESDVPEVREGNVGLAFALVLGAAAATLVGAMVVFLPFLVHLGNRKMLASGLGLSAGVMLYLSLIDIIVKSNEEFITSGKSEADAFLYTNITFFCGVVLTLVSGVPIVSAQLSIYIASRLGLVSNTNSVLISFRIASSIFHVTHCF